MSTITKLVKTNERPLFLQGEGGSNGGSNGGGKGGFVPTIKFPNVSNKGSSLLDLNKSEAANNIVPFGRG